MEDSQKKPAEIDPSKLTEAARERLLKYKDDDKYIIIQDDDDVIVAEKFTDDDWTKVEEMIDTHPLFSKDVGNIENNELLQALQAIKYDETAETILENLYVFAEFTTERRQYCYARETTKLP